jgi:hypothetical protein
MSIPAYDLNIFALNQIIGELAQRADDLCEETAQTIRNGAQIAMSGQKSGRFYGQHQASAAGEAPAVVTGALKNSITIDKPAEAERLVIVEQEYETYLEIGTRYMAARPFLSPEVIRAEPRFRERAGSLFNVK